MDKEDLVRKTIEESINVKQKSADQLVDVMIEISDGIAKILSQNGTVYLFGNGGSAADAQHVAAEFIGRFESERCPLPAEALTTNTSILTAVSNDYDFTEIFSRQVKAKVKLHKQRGLCWRLAARCNSPIQPRERGWNPSQRRRQGTVCGFPACIFTLAECKPAARTACSAAKVLPDLICGTPLNCTPIGDGLTKAMIASFRILPFLISHPSSLLPSCPLA